MELMMSLEASVKKIEASSQSDSPMTKVDRSTYAGFS